jgi:subtilisin family serine protease
MLTPRGRSREPSQIGALAVVALAATLLVVFAARDDDELKAEPAAAAATWTGLVGEGRPEVDVDRWRVVVLKAPSLARRVAAAGGIATEAQERRWATMAANAQKQLLSRLALQGIQISTEFTYTRVINGFSALLDPQAIGVLERAPEVEGVYPVRVAYPATVPQSLVRKAMASTGASARPPGLTLPGFDGRGVTVALLDTGVDRLHPYLRGRVLPGIDVVSGAGPAAAKPNPDDPEDIERHGTELAGVVAGRGGAFGARGIAPGATLLPIRVAGWQQDRGGGWAVYSRSDQLIAGLEAAVDPNEDGDAHDAARIALVGLGEPYVSFPDAPEARAVNGALGLDTLVVAAAGNDLVAGPAFGTISGPGGAPGALTVGAADLRSRTMEVHVAVRAGLEVRLSRTLPLAGVFAPDHALTLPLGAPSTAGNGAPDNSPPSRMSDFFDEDGMSLVAGRAALVPAGASPGRAVENAARAGAHAVLLYGQGLPAGALGLDESVVVPVIVFPRAAAEALLEELRAGTNVSVSLGAPRAGLNTGGGRVADFSSRGLAYDGRVKPDLAAPGVTVPTAEPGTNEDGTPRFGTVNGTSVAAASVAGAAALLAQARPLLGAADLMGLLTGTAQRLPHDPVEAQGAGLVDVGAAAAAEVSARPTTLALPPAGSELRTVRMISVRNVSTRRLRLRVSGAVRGEAFSLTFSPKRLVLRPGRTARVKVVAKTAARLPRTLEGAIAITPSSGVGIRIPWIAAPRPRGSLLWRVHLSPRRFDPAETSPILTLNAGRVFHKQVQALSRLQIALRTKQGRRLGLLANMRDLLPGTYSFFLTGRAPSGQLLGKGSYELIIRGIPTTRGPASRKTVELKIEK